MVQGSLEVFTSSTNLDNCRPTHSEGFPSGLSTGWNRHRHSSWFLGRFKIQSFVFQLCNWWLFCSFSRTQVSFSKHITADSFLKRVGAMTSERWNKNASDETTTWTWITTGFEPEEGFPEKSWTATRSRTRDAAAALANRKDHHKVPLSSYWVVGFKKTEMHSSSSSSDREWNNQTFNSLRISDFSETLGFQILFESAWDTSFVKMAHGVKVVCHEGDDYLQVFCCNCMKWFGAKLYFFPGRRFRKRKTRERRIRTDHLWAPSQRLKSLCGKKNTRSETE